VLLQQLFLVSSYFVLLFQLSFQVTGPLTAKFQLETGYRRSSLAANLVIGSTFSGASLRFGDGTSASFNYKVVSMSILVRNTVGLERNAFLMACFV
jgi:hypothetical protein